MRQQSFQVAFEKALAEPIGYAVGKTCRRARLIGTQNPSHALFAQIIGLIRFTQHREFAAAALTIGFEFRRLVVHDVLVLDRNRGHVKAEQPPGLARIIAGGTHHVLGHDVSFVRRQMPLAGGGAFYRGDLGLLLNLRAAGARALAQRHGQIRRRDVAVIGVVERSDDFRGGCAVAEFDQRPKIADLLRTDHLEGHADGVRRAAVLLVFVHAIAAGREPQIAGDVKAHILTGFSRQALVKIHGIFVQLTDRVAHVEKRQQSRCMPGRPGGEFSALEQDCVGPPFQGQVIKRADAYHAAADHDDARMSFHNKLPTQMRDAV